MPSVNQTINPLGPLIDVHIGVSVPRAEALKKAGEQIPTEIQARLLIDTGASGTCVDSSIVAKLGLTPSGSIDIHTPTTNGHPEPRDQYDVRLTIPHPSLSRVFGATPVIVSDNFQAQGIDGLLGRDILNLCVFIYNGETRHFTLSM